MNKLINYRINTLAAKISKQLSLSEILSLLETHNISPIGNLTNTPKKIILIRSLKNTKEKNVEDLVKQFSSDTLSTNNKKRIPILLHPTFRNTKVEKFIETKDIEEAIRIAFMRINNRVKKMTNSELDGAPLMRNVFSRNNPIIPLNELKTREDKDEQEGIMHIFEGSILAYRNPPSHNDEKRIKNTQAFMILELANYLMSLLDEFEKN